MWFCLTSGFRGVREDGSMPCVVTRMAAWRALSSMAGSRLFSSGPTSGTFIGITRWNR
jgi:hypothetical protein